MKSSEASAHARWKKRGAAIWLHGTTERGRSAACSSVPPRACRGLAAQPQRYRSAQRTSCGACQRRTTHEEREAPKLRPPARDACKVWKFSESPTRPRALRTAESGLPFATCRASGGSAVAAFVECGTSSGTTRTLAVSTQALLCGDKPNCAITPSLRCDEPYALQLLHSSCMLASALEEHAPPRMRPSRAVR